MQPHALGWVMPPKRSVNVFILPVVTRALVCPYRKGVTLCPWRQGRHAGITNIMPLTLAGFEIVVFAFIVAELAN